MMSNTRTKWGTKPTEYLGAFSLAGDTIDAFFDNLKPMLKAMIVPVLLCSSFNILVEAPETIATVISYDIDVNLLILLGVAVLLISVYLMASYAVSCHRINLLGVNAPRSPAGVGFSGRDWRFFGYSTAISLSTVCVVGLMVYAAYYIALSTITGLLIILPLGVTIYIIGTRFLLVLPMAAVDGPAGVRRNLDISWTLTKGSTTALVFAFILVTIGFAVVALLGEFAVTILAEPIGSTVPQTLVENFFQFASIAMGATLLSAAFRTLTGFTPSAPETETEQPSGTP